MTKKVFESLFLTFAVTFLTALCSDVKFATTPDLNLLYTSDNLFMQIVEPEEISYVYKVRPAKNFGGEFEKIYHHVPLVVANPYNGCSELVDKQLVHGAVVLIQRGDCSFVTKTINAENAGAVAVLITDNDTQNDEAQIQMVQDGTEREVQIPSLFLLGKDGYMIKATLEKYHMDSAIINIPFNITGMPTMINQQPPWTLW
ncbi:protease-associated domain-containing protein 1-like [Crassostrea virginica]|uniref:Protease-associated domain-containing protein 1-like n=1 Tax=Crassostrea virginica TaxID=6565 RepID=A0A8B8E992_CRAVI|nr:protease-associated domain-containing protein 1-like [Crassostrea virginica]